MSNLNLNSLWFSLGPLIGVNILFLTTLAIFRPIYRSRDRIKEVEERPASKLLNRWVREYWLWLTDPLVRLFISCRLSPNTVTTLGLPFAFVSGYFFSKGHFGLGGWLFILGSSFDTLDGRVARATGRETKSGAYFDSIIDRISESIVFLGLALYYRNHWALWLVIVALVGSLMVSYSKAQGGASGVQYSGGMMQRPERIVYLGVGAIFAPVVGIFISSRIADHLFLIPLGFVALMTWVTTYDRVKNSMKMMNGK